MRNMYYKLAFILCAAITPALVIAQIGIEILLPLDVKHRMMTENGPHEFAQFATLAIAALVALFTLIQMDRSHDKLMTGWVALALVCCIYVAGEEVSWGQHLFDWTTPEGWAALNDQGETNLHNTSACLDQKPRLLLEIGVIVGGLLVPLLRKLRPSALPPRFTAFYPGNLLVLPALGAEGTKITQTVCEELLGYHPFHRVSEVQELFFFIFVLAYLLTLRARLLARP